MRCLPCALPSCGQSSQPWSPTTSAEPSPYRYCVVSLVDPSDPYYRAVEELQRLHNATVLTTDFESIDRLLPDLQNVNPEYVAIVVKPETFEVNLVQRFMRLATQVDDDPFLDFAYGFITGDTPQTALSLIKAGQLSDPQITPSISMVAVGGANMPSKSSTCEQQLPLRSGYLTQTTHTIASDKGRRDTAYIESVMPKLDNRPILVLAGHGYPNEVVGGPTYEQLKERDFHGAIALNIACYTGVTGTWYEDDWNTMKVKQRKVPAEESFCLNMLKTGVAGYIAYTSARPSGPTMLGDSMILATSGETLGELRRQDGNSVVLAHLQQGFASLQIKDVTADTPLVRNRKTQDLLLAMSTGGLLFGDPACRPFAAKQNADPRLTTISHADGVLRAAHRSLWTALAFLLFRPNCDVGRTDTIFQNRINDPTGESLRNECSFAGILVRRRAASVAGRRRTAPQPAPPACQSVIPAACDARVDEAESIRRVWPV